MVQQRLATPDELLDVLHRLERVRHSALLRSMIAEAVEGAERAVILGEVLGDQQRHALMRRVRGRIGLRVRGVHAIDLGGLEHDIDAHFARHRSDVAADALFQRRIANCQRLLTQRRPVARGLEGLVPGQHALADGEFRLPAQRANFCRINGIAPIVPRTIFYVFNCTLVISCDTDYFFG